MAKNQFDDDPFSQQQEKHSIWPYSYQELLDDFLKAPECLKNCLDEYFSEHSKQRFLNLQMKLKTKQFSNIVFIGNTINYFSSFIARYTIMRSQKDKLFSWSCYEITEFFNYMLPKKIENTLYIFISNSGESRLLIQSIDHLKLLKINPDHIWLITNVKSSPVRDMCGEIFYTHVKSELVLGLKSFQNTVIVLYLLAQLFLDENPCSDEIFSNISNLVEEMSIFRSERDHIIQRILEVIEYRLEYLYFIARDPASLATAKLNALRLKTYHRQFAEGISLGLFFHGPFQIFERIEEHKLGAMFLVGNKKFESYAPKNRAIVGESVVDNNLIKEKIGSKHTFIRMVNLLKKHTNRIVILSNNKSLNNWFKEDETISIINFHSEIEELAPIFENFILSLVFLRIAKRDHLVQ